MCDELVKVEQHRDVMRAVASLSDGRSANANELARIQADHARWYESISELRGWYKQDTENVRQAFCTLEESPGDHYEAEAYLTKLDAIVDRMVARLSPKWNDLTRESSRLLSRLKQLDAEDDDAIKPGTARTREAIEKTERSMYNLLAAELKGTNDPEFRAMLETGKNEHKRIQSDSSKCTVAELTIGSRRIDCIRVAGDVCYVVEIKPNNSAAKARGMIQLQDALKQIESALGGKAKREELTGGLAVFQACFNETSKRAKLETELRVYEFCPPDGKLFHDFVVP